MLTSSMLSVTSILCSTCLAPYIAFGIPTKTSLVWQVLSCVNWHHSHFWGYGFVLTLSHCWCWDLYLEIMRDGAVLSQRIDLFSYEILWGRWVRKWERWESPWWSLFSSNNLSPWWAEVLGRVEKPLAASPRLHLDTKGCISKSHNVMLIM